MRYKYIKHIKKTTCNYTKVVYVFTKLYDAQAQKCLMIYDI